jgi:hypothetical protein
VPILNAAPTKQTPLPILKTTISPNAWGIASINHVKRGQVGIMYNKKGPALHVYQLHTKTRPKVPLVFHSKVPAFQGNCFLLSHYTWGNTNRLGGYFNRFQKKPSYASVAIAKTNGKHRALTLSYRREQTGFCGFWTHLFDFKMGRSSRVYLDASGFKWLMFWIRGSKGSEQIRLKVADGFWEKKGDALPVGMVHTYLPHKRITTQWQLARIPLTQLPKRLKPTQLASLVFEATAGTGTVYIKSAAFCQKRTPVIPLPPPAKRINQIKRGKRLSRATWLWHTQQYLDSAVKRQTLASTLKQQHFTHLFIQLPNRPKDLNKKWPSTLQTAKWKALILQLHRAGIKVYALEGYKEYALPKWHPRVIQTVRQVIAYNKRVPPAARFDGIRYDIEPYLLPAFRGNLRQWLMQHYLSLLTRLTTMSHAHNMTFGVDVPFWFDRLDPATGKPDRILFNGHRRAISEHIIDIVDDVGIMDYRTQAYGADGIVRHAAEELLYASQRGKQIFVGLETLSLPNEDLLFLKGKPQRGWPTQTKGFGFVFLRIDQPRKWQVHFVPHARYKQWRQTHAHWHQPSRPLLFWHIPRPVHVSSNKVTFARLGHKRLQTAMHLSQKELVRYKSFAGFAIHSYTSFQQLLATQKTKAYPPPKQ